MKYSEINIGDKANLQHQITKEDINKFVELTGDDNKLHINEEYAKTTSFKKPVVHGMLGASFISTIIGTKLPGDGALWFSQTLEFLLPVRVGDELNIVAEVIKKYDSEHIIEIKVEILNQNKQIVTKGISKVKVIEQITEFSNPEPEKKTRTALILGATGGIGAAVCKTLAEEGFHLVIHYNSSLETAENIKLFAESCNVKAITIKANLQNEDEIETMVLKSIRKFENIDVMVNCSAIPIPNIKFENLIWEDYQKQIDMNIKSNFILLKKIVPYMIANKYGKIIHLGSLVTDKPNADWSHYISAKAALIGFTKSLALELSPKGIRVNMVSPSLVDTDLTANISEKYKLLTASQTPLRKLATVLDVANTIAFLASEKSDFISGENIRVNGGQVMI